MNILCTVCARGGSKMLKNKNIKKLLNKPLIIHTLFQAKKSGIFDKTVVSSDSNAIINLSKSFVDHTIKRPKKLAGDKTSKILAIKHALIQTEKYFNKKFDVIVDLDATSPLRKKKDIVNAMNKFIKKKYKNLVSVCHSKKNPYFNVIEKIGKKVKLVKNSKNFFSGRQDAPEVYDVNASIYIWKRSALLNTRRVLTNKTGIYVMPADRSIDIDSDLDFKLVKFLMKDKKNKSG